MEEKGIPIINQILNLKGAASETLKLKNSMEEKLIKIYSEDLKKNSENKNLIKNFESLSKNLIAMGIKPKIALNGFLAFKYSNIEEALELLCKSPEGEYKHRFIPSDQSLCFVCEESEEKHRSISKLLTNKSFKRNSIFDENENLKKKIAEKEINLRRSLSIKGNRISSLFLDKKIIELDNFHSDKNLINLNQKLIFEIENNKENKNSKKNNLIECPICFMEIEKDKMFYLECNHIFCVDCVKDYLNEEIKNSRVARIACPQKNCSFAFDEGKIREIVSEEIFVKYKRFLLRENIKNNPDIIECPITNCEGFASRVDSVINKGNLKLQKIFFK